MYDFKSLSSHDFELLTRDLLQKFLNLHLESFKIGRDKGIDLRYSRPMLNESLIVQCKHYPSTPLSNLISELKNKESAKVIALSPTRYILVTSLGLTPSNKKTITEALLPTIVSESDIFGFDDINNLLGQYPEVERKHFKLWLTSTTLLEKIVNSSAFNESEIEIELIQKKIQLYVQNNSFLDARKILEETHTCVISGIPGIGKTTLAEMLLIDYLGKGFEVVKITNGMDNAFKRFSKGKKQIFYYDDFLGQTQLGDQLKKNEDDQIRNFITHISESSNHRFILTTREYILQKAYLQYEKLILAGLSISKCILKLEDYSDLERAQILYNHIYFSGLENGFIEEILKDKNYFKIIKHPNYSPRIIEWMTLHYKLLASPKLSYFNSFLENLDNPAKLWQHAFDEQISNAGRALILVVSSLPNHVSLENVELVFNSLYNYQAKKYLWSTRPIDFKSALKETDGTFIQTRLTHSGKTLLNFHNPSINDFIQSYLLENEQTAKELCVSAVFFDQIQKIGTAVKQINTTSILSSFITDSDFASIAQELINRDNKIFAGDSGYYRQNTFEQNLYSLLLAVNSRNLPKSPPLFSSLISTLSDRIINKKSDGEFLLKCVEILEKYHSLYFGKRMEILASCSEFFLNLTSYEDCYYLHAWKEMFPEFSLEQRYIDVVANIPDFLSEEINSWFGDLSEAHEFIDAANDIDHIAELFDLDLYFHAQDLKDKAKEIDRRNEEEEDDSYDDDYGGGGGSSQASNSDSAVSDLFDLLSKK